MLVAARIGCRIRCNGGNVERILRDVLILVLVIVLVIVRETGCCQLLDSSKGSHLYGQRRASRLAPAERGNRPKGANRCHAAQADGRYRSERCVR